jgi:hypothetical protein
MTRDSVDWGRGLARHEDNVHALVVTNAVPKPKVAPLHSPRVRGSGRRNANARVRDGGKCPRFHERLDGPADSTTAFRARLDAEPCERFPKLRFEDAEPCHFVGRGNGSPSSSSSSSYAAFCGMRSPRASRANASRAACASSGCGTKRDGFSARAARVVDFFFTRETYHLAQSPQSLQSARLVHTTHLVQLTRVSNGT